MIDAFLFDLDGTLQDSEVLYVEAWKQMYREKGCEVSQSTALELVYGLANSEVHAGFEQLFPGACADLSDALLGLKKHFAIVKDGKDVRIHSSIALLRDLSRSRPICIVSGSE
ncbi:MAG: HAD hydrolase-like protein, partial [Planctomycetota bacterium]|nr:HAD hydrolase-like protein [Planctomycetota bacterium]